MTEKIIGRIDKIDVSEGEKPDGSSWKRGSFEIKGFKHSTFDMKVIDTFKVGDFVELEYELAGDKNQFKNITTMKKSEFTSGKDYTPAQSSPDVQKSIVRQSCLKSSVELLKAIAQVDPLKIGDSPTDTAISIAEAFEHWVNRE